MEIKNISSNNINDFNIPKHIYTQQYEQKENFLPRYLNIHTRKSTDDSFESPAPTKKQNNQAMSSIINSNFCLQKQSPNTNFSLQKQSPFLKNSRSSRIPKLFRTNDDFEDFEKSIQFDQNINSINQSNTLSQLLFKIKSPLEDSVVVSEFSMNSQDQMDLDTPELKFNLQKKFSDIIDFDIQNDWSDSINLERRNSAIEQDCTQMDPKILQNNLQKEIQEFKRIRINMQKFSLQDPIQEIQEFKRMRIIKKFSCQDPICSKNSLEIIHDNDLEDQVDDFHNLKVRLFQDEQDYQNKMEFEELTPMRKLSFRQNLSNILPNNQKQKKNNSKSNNNQFRNIKKDLKILSILSKKQNMNVYICQSTLNQQKYILKEIPILNELQDETLADLRVLAKWGKGDKKENEFFVKFYDSWIEEGKLYVVIEICQYSLEKIIQQRPNENTIRKILIDVSTGLNFLHQQQCYHMVIKPSNILLSYSGKFKIADLGVSWLNHQFVSDYWTLDKSYFAPEFDCRKEQDIDYQKCDIYSLGIILHELVEGSEFKLKQKIKSITNNQKYSNSLTYLIRRMTDQCPSMRPTAQEILDKMFTDGDDDQLKIERKYFKEQNEDLQRKINEIELKIQKDNMNFKIFRKNSSQF